jgi:glycerate kinase
VRILIAPDKFKGSLSALEAATAIADGWRMGSAPGLDLELRCRPVADGGEGTAQVIRDALDGYWVSCNVSDPLGRPITAKYAVITNGAIKTAVLDMSEASGLWRVAQDERCVDRQSTYGTGEMVSHALRHSGVDRVVIGLGGSATNDGGIGLAAALGFCFVGDDGISLEPLPANLSRIRRIISPSDLSSIKGRVVGAIDVFNPLLGERGASRIYGPQKGLVDEKEVSLHESRLGYLADVVTAWSGHDLRDRPGTGAAGGLGFGLIAFCEAELSPGFDEVAKLLNLSAEVASSDLIITGEGSLDSQTLEGKAPVGVAKLARQFGKPCIAFAGRVEGTVLPVLLKHFDKITALTESSVSDADAIRHARAILRSRTAGVASQWRNLP